ncbi:helix-turn-helix domain-containing protein [Lentibacillus jeotgali]|uniref:helix-turn-helix domain-containing protein n=1 Tax=Lentibacillus jeotgali TaxID=558169 RepID=UPI0002626FF0|nr:helix-turn-helix transcriptional regulator [Lentibacillus jeotgali]
MVNIMKLKGKIVENGMNVGDLAKQMKIDRATFYRRMNDNGDTFTIKEVQQICKLLNLTNEEAISIFLILKSH